MTMLDDPGRETLLIDVTVVNKREANRHKRPERLGYTHISYDTSVSRDG
ncbi:hypothetical protein HC031_03270 [Planosporangium thailandense]|uniref:Transposase n=1 Tax=Planosporangium thailandense TaxID=765197 RepID=A0ABX0XRW8_9ACTN|nr:hypothetical protein [Planosporangium thailandense]NJC68751.1 hypothetical protein [Planosporangium thailandense]